MNDDAVYAAYLNAFATTRSGGELDERAHNIDLETLAARALGASDGGEDRFMPAPRWLLREEVNRILHSKNEETPCRVVPMNEKGKP